MIRKDIFVIHDPSSFIERRTAHDLTALLKGAGFSLYGGADLGERREGPDRSEWSYSEGSSIDMDRYRRGEPFLRRPACSEDDSNDLLPWVIEHSRLLIVLQPAAGRPCPMLRQAIQQLKRPRTRKKMQNCPVLLCLFDDGSLHPALEGVVFTSQVNIGPVPGLRHGLPLARREPVPSDVHLASLRAMTLLLAHPLRTGTTATPVAADVDKKRVLKGLCQTVDSVESDIQIRDRDRLDEPSLLREAISLCDSLTLECDWTSAWPAEAAGLAADMRGRLGALLFSKDH